MGRKVFDSKLNDWVKGEMSHMQNRKLNLNPALHISFYL